MTKPVRTHWSWVGLAWLLLPIGAWLVGTLWLGGDIGRSTDDYAANLRDPATGELPSPFNPWVRFPFFWRPLHVSMCFTLGTLLAQHWRVLAILCAIVHGLACLSVFALLRRGGAQRGPAAAGALLLLVHPMNFEVAFWLLSISAAIGAGLWCMGAIWAIRLTTREQPPRAMELLGFALLGLAIPCFYEQPATGVLALPLVLLAAWLAARARGAAATPVRPAAGRAVLLTAIAGAANVVYLVLMRATVPRSFRGGADSLVKPDRLIERVGEVAGSVRWQLWGVRLRQTTAGAWEVGVETLSTPVGVAAVGALLVGALIWAWAWAVDAGESPPADRPRPELGARACWVLAGVTVFVGAFVPIALLGRQNVEPRTLYFPLVGAAIVLAQALDVAVALLRRDRFGAAGRAALAIIVAAGVIAGAVCGVGIQTWLQRRSQRDEAVARQLAALVPNPPPGGVFLPLRLDDGVTRTGRLHFDRLRPAAFSTPWSAGALMRESLRRADLRAASINPWAPYPYGSFTPEGLRFDAWPERLPWDRVVPFVIEPDGRVRLVRQVEILRADDRTDTFAVPAVRAAIRSGAARGRATAITLTDSADPPPPLVSGWRWVLTTAEPGELVRFKTLESRGIRRESEWLHPGYQEGARRAIEAPLEPAAHARALRFRVTTPPSDYERFPGATPVTLTVEVRAAGAAGVVASATLELTRELAESEPRWVALELTIPAAEAPQTLRVTATGAPRGPHAPIWVTPGMWVNPDPTSR